MAPAGEDDGSAAYGERPKGEAMALYAGVLDELEAAITDLEEALA